ncbi:MAG: ribonuclease Z [Candidatus Bathyarchaeota archaeon]|nr:ribonuclease Z [Candidatus Bathyarchaeota archaeon]
MKLQSLRRCSELSVKLVFLGTGAAVPTAQRSLPSVVLLFGNEQIMFDCGEAVQRQMILAKISLHKKLHVFITHMHGDHVLGLPGLLQTMALMDRKKPVDVYGPAGLGHFLECLQETLQFQLTFQVNVHEVAASGLVCDEQEYAVSAVPSNHAVTSFSFAFEEKPRPGRFHPEKAAALGVPKGEAWSRLQHGNAVPLSSGRVVKPEDVADPPRKGRKIVYSGDTRPFDGFSVFAENADVVIHEATFDDALVEKAEVDGHSTPSQAALEAKAANAKRLVLTHISARYSDVALILEQAQKVFPNTLVAHDFLELELPLSE